jgi:hypothetical protein
MSGKGSQRFAKALKTAAGGNAKKVRQARHIQKSVEKKHGKKRGGMAAMGAASEQMSLEAALDELELPSGPDPRDVPWQDTPYPTGKDPRYDLRDKEKPPIKLRKPGERTAITPQKEDFDPDEEDRERRYSKHTRGKPRPPGPDIMTKGRVWEKLLKQQADINYKVMEFEEKGLTEEEYEYLRFHPAFDIGEYK